ncbi:hypothetical protein BS50DRAFT_322881 [Corynespora cassiicola Philippines]|uniref:Only prolin and serin are matching in the corresponding protein n=1 Tax=Corynespora cassiicola Philippines TaxID=1448308 RepID=A0A2T2NTU3_CORCC|nr:hypothetical protein BS50DRAFT_322881 [Corynespora cassiicola Philippines]
MREMKPLMLPKLVAARKPSKSSLDMSAEPTSSVYSSTDSGFYSASECSTPPTPSFYPPRGHLRHPSSTSSLSSSPPNCTYDPIEGPNASGKLPKLTEEPIEREDDYVTVHAPRFSCDDDADLYLTTRTSTFRSHHDDEEVVTFDYFSKLGDESHMAKRRRSVESSANSITSKIETRFPSLSRKVRDRKRASGFGRSSRSTTPSRVPSTRSSSITSSIHQSQGIDLSERFNVSTTPARLSKEQLNDSFPPSPCPIDIHKANAPEIDVEQIERERCATTPLLPPTLLNARLDQLPAESPLQSPTVADASQSLVATPIDTPQVRGTPILPTPPLSSQPSVSSFNVSRSAHLMPASDIPPIMLTDPNDKWSNILGHANFTIQPEPYLPDVCDTASLRQLFADWEQARCNFTKHQVRVAEHHGVTSSVYMNTEKKWVEIDAQWKANHDLTMSRAAAMGQEPEPTSPSEPAPLSKMPSLNDPKSEGKFPKLGDEDIVGPMVQIASHVQKTPRKRAFFKFFSDMKFPGAFLGRSSTVRSQ